MSPADAVLTVQRCYPQIYLACHTRHKRGRSSEHRISDRDSSILAHLDQRDPIAPAQLSRHLGITASTLSAALKRLVSLGYVDARRTSHDGRRIELRLTAKGQRAMSGSSVLDADRVETVLARLTAAERQRAIAGLELLARASRACMGRRG